MLLSEIFPVNILRKVIKLYQADPLEEANHPALGLSEIKRRNACSYYGFGWLKWLNSTRTLPLEWLMRREL